MNPGLQEIKRGANNPLHRVGDKSNLLLLNIMRRWKVNYLALAVQKEL